MFVGERGLYRRGALSGSLSAVFGARMLPQDVDRHLTAFAAIRGHAKLLLQLPQTRDAGLGRLADLFVGDRVANTDVHTFQWLMISHNIEPEMRMIVNSITYKPRHVS